MESSDSPVVIRPKTYPLSPNPVFWTIQGEGHLRGFQMAFVRLAGCSVGCAECDTDHSVGSRATPAEIAAFADSVTPSTARDRWIWITGGEPLDHALPPAVCRAARGVELGALGTLGIGSVCRRQHTRGTCALIKQLAGAGLSLHAFGFKKTGLRTVHTSLYSADSMAWSFCGRRAAPLAGRVAGRPACLTS